MSNYDIKISKLLKDSKDGKIKTEIWTKIKNRETSKIINKRIWWQDDKGVYHDATPELPINLRKRIDNLWIEMRRKF